MGNEPHTLHKTARQQFDCRRRAFFVFSQLRSKNSTGLPCCHVTTRRYLWTGSWKQRALDVGANAAAEKNGVGRTQVKESNAPAVAVARPAAASIFNPFCAAPFNSAADRRGRGKGEAERGRGEAGREGDSRSGRGSAVPCPSRV